MDLFIGTTVEVIMVGVASEGTGVAVSVCVTSSVAAGEPHATKRSVINTALVTC
jgi:hypothetical protein